ncbi:MAG: DUF427 domain-containing protein [Pseudobacteriovorax sp.]|nr:DUF427 domain-containing protein [Pseudobacteriovorax sp.]
MKATWKGTILADSDDTVMVENNHYFPMNSLKKEFFLDSSTTSHCPWKGEANYFTISVGDEKNRDAAWYYLNPKEKAQNIKGRVAFWKGVDIIS